MELGLDPPDLPMGMLTDIHLKRCKAWWSKLFGYHFAITILTCEWWSLYFFFRRRGITRVC